VPPRPRTCKTVVEASGRRKVSSTATPKASFSGSPQAVAFRGSRNARLPLISTAAIASAVVGAGVGGS